VLIFQRIRWRFSSSTSSKATWLPTTLTLVPALIVDCSSWSHALSAHRQLAAGPVCQHYPRLYDPIYRTVKAMKICMYSCTMERCGPTDPSSIGKHQPRKLLLGISPRSKKDGLETSTAQTRARHRTSSGLLLQHQDYTDPLFIRVYMYVRGPHTHVRICCCSPISYVSEIRSPLKRS